MAVDPTLLRPTVQFDPAGAQAKAFQLKDMIQTSQLNDIKLQTEKKEMQESQQIQDALKDADVSTPEGQSKALSKVQKIAPMKAMELERQFGAARISKVQLEREEIETSLARLTPMANAAESVVNAYDMQIQKLREGYTAQGKNPDDPSIKAAIEKSAAMASMPVLHGQLQMLQGLKDSQGKPIIPQEVMQMVSQGMGQEPPEKLINDRLRPFAVQSKQHIPNLQRALEERRFTQQVKHETKEEELGAGRLEEERRFHRETAAGGFGGGTAEDQAKIRSTMGYLAELNVNLPTGMRSQKQIAATVKGLIDNHPGMTPRDLAGLVKQGVLDLTGEKREAATAGNIAGKIAYAEQEIIRLAPVVEKASADVPRGQFVPWNRLSQYTAKQLSDPKLKTLYSYMNTLSNAYDMLAARGGTDMEKRAHNRAMFDAADSPEALKAALDAVVNEARISQEAAQATMHPATAPAPAQQEFTATGPKGEKMKWNGTAWVPVGG
jgi:hypothetical protein